MREQATSISASSQTTSSALSKSRFFRDYAKAFTKASGLPLALRAPMNGRSAVPWHGESSFCAMLAGKNPACAKCDQFQRRLERKSQTTACTMSCLAGIRETAIPVRLNDQLIGFLRTGHVRQRAPSRQTFGRVAREMSIVGSSVNLKQAEEAWLTTQVISPSKYDAFITMLTVFARHLEACSLSLIEDSPTSTSASPAIKRAQRLIVDHLADDISLGDVAREVNLSAPYFCKHFRESAGISFVEYLTRVRAERARELLMNPELRISEAAYLAGFQSVSQFNRVFRRIVGESPSNWRRKQRARAAIPGIDAQQAH